MTLRLLAWLARVPYIPGQACPHQREFEVSFVFFGGIALNVGILRFQRREFVGRERVHVADDGVDAQAVVCRDADAAVGCDDQRIPGLIEGTLHHFTVLDDAICEDQRFHR